MPLTEITIRVTDDVPIHQNWPLFNGAKPHLLIDGKRKTCQIWKAEGDRVLGERLNVELGLRLDVVTPSIEGLEEVLVSGKLVEFWGGPKLRFGGKIE